MILLNEKSELKNISNFFIFSDKNVFLKKSLLPGIDDFCSVLDFYDEKLDFIIEPEQNYSSVILPSPEDGVPKFQSDNIFFIIQNLKMHLFHAHILCGNGTIP